jgi:hypothetical protein
MEIRKINFRKGNLFNSAWVAKFVEVAFIGPVHAGRQPISNTPAKVRASTDSLLIADIAREPCQ